MPKAAYRSDFRENTNFCPQRDANLGPLAPQASVLPLDHCDLRWKFFFGRALPLFWSKSTITRFGERFRDGQYSLASFLFAVLLLTVPYMESAWQ